MSSETTSSNVEIAGKSYPALADGEYDVIVLGTGLKECIVAGLLAVEGKKVCARSQDPAFCMQHVMLRVRTIWRALFGGAGPLGRSRRPPFPQVLQLDRNNYYGSESASLNLTVRVFPCSFRRCLAVAAADTTACAWGRRRRRTCTASSATRTRPRPRQSALVPTVTGMSTSFPSSSWREAAWSRSCCTPASITTWSSRTSTAPMCTRAGSTRACWAPLPRFRPARLRGEPGRAGRWPPRR